MTFAAVYENIIAARASNPYEREGPVCYRPLPQAAGGDCGADVAIEYVQYNRAEVKDELQTLSEPGCPQPGIEAGGTLSEPGCPQPGIEAGVKLRAGDSPALKDRRESEIAPPPPAA